MASIKKYKTANGHAWRVQYTGADGKRRGKRGFRTKAEAEKWAADVMVEKTNGTWIPPELEATKVQELWPRWIEAKKRKGLKPSSIRKLESVWDTHVNPQWGEVAVKNIKPAAVQDWVDKLAGTRKGTAARPAHSLLANLLNDAKRLGMLRDNPCALTELPAKPAKKMYVLTPEQGKAFIKACDRFKSLAAFLLFVGCRWGEATALTVGDIDVKRGTVRISKTVLRINGEVVVGPTKNGVTRTAAVPKSVLELMKPDLKDKLPGALVWSNRDGSPVSVPTRRSWFHRALDACQDADPTFPDITPHDLRHAAVSMMLSNGASIVQVQNQVGHSSAKITLDIYSHILPDDVSALGARLDSLAIDVVKNESNSA
ncbi:site-specific integrase [Staphylococcus chromogenes]|nr:site-specific integrase [Staphylococcus chromogenes]